MWRHLIGLLAAAALSASASAATTVRLPAAACLANDALFVDGFEVPGATGPGAPSDPSLGSGGALGDSSASIAIAGWPADTYYVHVPPAYDPSRPAPVLLALHGAAGSHALAVSSAQQIRTDWAPAADAGGFIVVVPVGSDSQGSWFVPSSAADHPTDYDLFAAELAQVESRYNIERTRRYGWGYSAGGHVMHDLLVNGFNASLDATKLAAYGVSAGILGDQYAPTWGLACRGLTEDECGALLAAMPRIVPVDIHVGVSDPLVTHARLDYGIFTGQGWVDGDTLHYTEINAGHIYLPANLPVIWSNVCTFAVTNG